MAKGIGFPTPGKVSGGSMKAPKIKSPVAPKFISKSVTPMRKGGKVKAKGK